MSAPFRMAVAACAVVPLTAACGDFNDSYLERVQYGLNGALPLAPPGKIDVVPGAGTNMAHGHLDAVSVTYDGRVTVTKVNSEVSFKTTVPERFDGHIRSEGFKATRSGARLQGNLAHSSSRPYAALGHTSVCDPKDDANPRDCMDGADRADCYDVTVVSAALSEPPSGTAVYELWGVPVTAYVTQPKSKNARVSRVVTRGQPRRSAFEVVRNNNVGSILEPVISGDGRIIVIHNINIGLQYSVLGPDREPCDVRGWDTFRPISEMHQDPLMSPYGIAEFPLRDTTGREFYSGEAILGAYPWLDRDSNNLFFTQAAAQLFFDRNGSRQSRYPVRNLSSFLSRPLDEFSDGATRVGVSFAGLWSHGKTVLLDGRVNNVDYGLKGLEGEPPLLSLYQDRPEGTAAGESVVVDVNSPEGQLNYMDVLLPQTPRDVVWQVSVSRLTDEVAFDDYIDPNVLVFLPMNAPVDNAQARYLDGFDYRGTEQSTMEPKLQNAGTAHNLNSPSYGRLLGGARVEPIAAGGVKGKGVWLDGTDDEIRLTVPGNAGVEDDTWFTSIWVNARGLDRSRRLLTFPDGSSVDLQSMEEILISGPDAQESVFVRKGWVKIRPVAWRHLAFVSHPNSLDVYVNGYLIKVIDGSFLRPVAGTLSVGGRDGFRGWVDEFKVIRGDLNPEVVCNHSYGTLVGATTNTGRKIARAYPEIGDERIQDLLPVDAPTYGAYFCEQKFSTLKTNRCRGKIHPHQSTPEECLREPLLFPKGPLVWDEPRPRTRANNFCRSCHSSQQRKKSLSLDALNRISVPLYQDLRRQPFQTSARLFGWIPASLAGQQIRAPNGGFVMDRVLLP